MTVPGQILDRPNLDRTIPRHGHILDISTKQYFFDKLFLQWGRLGLHNGGRALQLEQARGPSAAARAPIM